MSILVEQYIDSNKAVFVLDIEFQIYLLNKKIYSKVSSHENKLFVSTNTTPDLFTEFAETSSTKQASIIAEIINERGCISYEDLVKLKMPKN